MRPFFYEYPGLDVTDQFLLGRSIMVSPIIEEGIRERSVVVPEGRWYSINMGKTLEGRAIITLSLPMDEIGIFLNMDSPDYERLKKNIEDSLNG